MSTAVLTVSLLTLPRLAAGQDVKIDFDKAFNFKPVKTWRWNPEGPGDVKVGRNKNDDPAAFKSRAEPIILSAVVLIGSRRVP